MNARAPVRAVSDPDDLPCYTRGQVKDACRDVVLEGLEIIASEVQRPALCTTKDLVRELQVSDRTIYELRKEGLPTVHVCDSPRYVLADVLAWLKARPSK